MKKSILLLVLSLGLSVLCFYRCEIFDPVDQHQTGDTLWIHETPVHDSMFMTSTLALGKDQTIYYAAGGGTINWKPTQIFAINHEDGSLKWRSEKLDHMGLSSHIVVGDDGTVFAIGFYTLYALNPDDGTTKWSWRVPETLPNPDNPDVDVYTLGQIGKLALTNEGDLILGSTGSGAYSRALYCVDKDTGIKKWHNLGAVGWAVYGESITIGPNNTAYYYTELTHNNVTANYLIAVDAATGSIKWSTEVKTWTYSNNNIAIMSNGNLFCSFTLPGENTRKHHIVDAASGSILWSGSEASSGGGKWVGPDGTLYEYDGGLFRIDAATGVRTSVKVGEFGCITSNNRLVFAFTDDDYARRLGVFYPDGSLDFKVDMNGLVGHNSLVSNDNVIYSIIDEHPVSFIPTKISAIQGNSPLAGSGWPRLTHDNRNTSNWSK